MILKKQFNILVLDDDPDVLQVTVQMLQARGYPATTGCDTISQSQEWLTQNTYPLIFLDLHFNGMEGMDLLRQIRNGAFGPENQHAFIFILSGWVSMKAKLECERLSANAIFSKPVDFHELLDCVNQAYDDCASQD